MQRSIKVNKFLAVILSLLILLQICPLGVFSATAIYELKDTTATKIGSFTQSGQTMDIYKLSLDGSKYGSVQLKGRDMLGNRMPVLRTPSGQYKMIQLVRLGIVSETNIGKECYENTKGFLPEDIVNDCMEENTIGYYWYGMQPMPGLGPAVAHIAGFIIIEWSSATAVNEKRETSINALTEVWEAAKETDAYKNASGETADIASNVDSTYNETVTAINMAPSIKEIEEVKNTGIEAINTIIAGGEATGPTVEYIITYITVEKLFIDGNFIVEPTEMKLPKGLNAADLMMQALKARYPEKGEEAYRYNGGYLAGVWDPDFVYKGSGTVQKEGYLSEKDAGSFSGWMYCVNERFPSTGMDGYTLEDNDVMRLIYVGHYSATGGGANRSDLIRKVANIRKQYSNSIEAITEIYGTAYDDAMTVLKQTTVGEYEVSSALNALITIETSVSVTDIVDVPAEVAAETPLSLVGTVEPDNASHKEITWTVKNQGTTGAFIEKNILHTLSEGNVTVTATIENGKIKEDFSKDFDITVTISLAQQLEEAKQARIDQINAVYTGVDETDYTKDSWTRFYALIQSAIANVHAATTVDAINAVAIPSTDGLETVAAHLATLKTARIEKINAVINGLTEADYTPDSWTELQTAITDAIQAVTDATDAAAVEAVNIPSISGLVAAGSELEEVKRAKIAQINGVTNGFSETDYTADSWAALQTAIIDAIQAVNNATDVPAVKEVAIPSTDGLVAVASQLASAKEAKIAQIAAVTDGLNQSIYTKASWSALQSAMATATADVQNAKTLAAVEAISIPSTENLVTILDSEKAARIARFEAVFDGLVQAEYTEASWAALQTAVNNAKEEVNSAESVEEVKAVRIPSTDGLVTLKEELAAAKAEKKAQIEERNRYLYQLPYTPGSWTAYCRGYQTTMASIDAATTVEEVNAITFPSESMLVLRGDKGALREAITLAETKNQDHYIEGWDEFFNALRAAKQVEGDWNAAQGKVDNALANLNDRMTRLVLKDGYAGALNDVLNYIRSNVETPELGSIGGEWAILSLARGGFSDTPYYDGYYSRILTSIADKPDKLNDNKSTENSRLILALTSLGIGAVNVNGKNLIAPLLSDSEWVKRQGINGAVFALIAMDSLPYAKNSPVRQELVDYILSCQVGDGWSLDNTNPNLDITAMTIQALAPYKEQDDVSAAVGKALAWIVRQKITDSEGCSQVIVALSALGEDAADFNGKNYISILLSYYDATNKAFLRESAANLMSSEQGAYALVAYDRFKNGKARLYDMSDVVKMVSDDVLPAVADKTALEEKIAQAERYSESDYTAGSWSALQIELRDAKAVRDLETVTQAVVDNAVSSLVSAIAKLKIAEPAVQLKYVRLSVTDPNAKANQQSVYFPPTAMEMNDGETAYSILRRTGLTLRVSDHSQYAGVYVEAISGFGEFDDGPQSGWMYKVNGVFPGYSSSLYELKENDVVEWVYTRDLGKDVGGYLPGVEDTDTAEQGVATLTPKADVTGSDATASVTAEQINSAVKAVKSGSSGSVGIAPSGADKAKNVAVNIPTTAAKSIADEKNLGLEIDTPVGIITIPNDALTSIANEAKGSDIEVSIAKKSAADVTDDSIDTSSGIVVSVSISSDGKEISSFGGKSITIDIPVSNEFEAGETYSVVHISKNGSTENIKGECIKIDGKLYVRISVTHLSTFVVLLDDVVLAFTDLNKHWAVKEIKYVYAKGIMRGTSETTFEPRETLSRAMLVTMLYRLEKEPKADSKNIFTDVKKGMWYSDAICWAASNGIVNGYGEGIFAPNDSITREQMATILYRYAQYKNYDVSKTGDLTVFGDKKEISEWALGALKWANGEKLINGRTRTGIVPAGNTTRAEAAVMLTRFMKNIVK